MKVNKQGELITFVAATYAYTRAIDRSSRAVYRSILVLTLLAGTRTGQSAVCIELAFDRLGVITTQAS